MSDERSTIVLADDHSVVREGLRLLLERDGTMEVVAEAADGDSVLRYVRGHKPDVLVLDLNMPGRDSLDLLPEVLEISPSTHVVILTMQPEPAFARAALQAGAAGYVLKEAAHEELLRAINGARLGRTYVDPAVGAKLASEPAYPPGRPDGISDREAEVLEHIALGETNAEVAAELHISVRTVETHRAHIQEKTGCTSRSELVRYARKHGIGS
jgi:two-component system response regulator NreC